MAADGHDVLLTGGLRTGKGRREGHRAKGAGPGREGRTARRVHQCRTGLARRPEGTLQHGADGAELGTGHRPGRALQIQSRAPAELSSIRLEQGGTAGHAAIHRPGKGRLRRVPPCQPARRIRRLPDVGLVLRLHGRNPLPQLHRREVRRDSADGGQGTPRHEGSARALRGEGRRMVHLRDQSAAQRPRAGKRR